MPRMQQRWKSSSSGNCDQGKGVKTMQSPTALNKRGNKVTIDGYTFDSQKEANFYTKFVKDCGLPFEVHPRFKLTELTPTADGIGKISAIAYSPDFIIKNLDGSWRHVIDIKILLACMALTNPLSFVFVYLPLDMVIQLKRLLFVLEILK